MQIRPPTASLGDLCRHRRETTHEEYIGDPGLIARSAAAGDTGVVDNTGLLVIPPQATIASRRYLDNWRPGRKHR